MAKHQNTYQCSDGKRVTQSTIDARIAAAKFGALEDQFFDLGFNCCIVCKSNRYLERSHTISVKYAKETKRTELCWSLQNIKIRCHDCHVELDAKGNIEREEIHKEILFE